MTDIFNAPAPDEGAFDPTGPVIDPNKNYLEELVGEAKKFKSVEDLARSKVESDLFIERLKLETKTMRDELQKRLTVEDLLQRLEDKGKPVTAPVVNQHSTPAVSHEPDANSVDLDKITEAIRTKLEQDQIASKKNANLAEVASKMKEAYGDQANVIVQRKAQELGVSVDYLKSIAADSPKLFFTTIGDQPKARNDVFTPPANRVNTTGIPNQPQYGNHKPRSYYENLRKTNPKVYFDPKTAVQEHKDAIALGANFFDT